MLADAHTGRTCGLAMVPFVDGVSQVDLPVVMAHASAEKSYRPLMVMMVRGLDDLEKLEHYVVWTAEFQQVSEAIMTLDIAMVAEGRVQ